MDMLLAYHSFTAGELSTSTGITCSGLRFPAQHRFAGGCGFVEAQRRASECGALRMSSGFLVGFAGDLAHGVNEQVQLFARFALCRLDQSARRARSDGKRCKCNRVETVVDEALG